MTSSCILGSVQVEKSRKLELFVFSPICLKFRTEGNFDMVITKRRPKLKSEDDFSKKSILAKIIPSTLQQ